MARFPYYKKNIEDLGRLLARARMDLAFRATFIADPKMHLRSIGLPENVIALIGFKVVDDTEGGVSVIPYRLNQTALDTEDPAYLEGLADLFPDAGNTGGSKKPLN
ncbi:hypothetical protein E1180_09580 [Roseibium denhamense]|uniref:Uncharacterized protein n=1 Tax=Roseibium denhamense TaxID=76305 RepID=A0ABY1PR35_9HYPH|nr:hypothetical protein [Roseibium denhamense]MTI05766.1 hypothetical protein [Roseibium denhamense]SMP36998.1 hypothetical protein SAMN06265374_4435 [Roseibium denhamense]